MAALCDFWPATESAVNEEPQRVATLSLVALPTALLVADLFVSNTLYRWRGRLIEDKMRAATGELVKIAVAASGVDERTSWTGITNLSSIKLRMMGFQHSITIEVIDRHREPLVLADDDQTPEDRGLPLVDTLATAWGSCVEPDYRVMWANFSIHQTTSAGLPKRRPREQLPAPHSTAEPANLGSGDLDLMQQVLDGLRKL